MCQGDFAASVKEILPIPGEEYAARLLQDELIYPGSAR